MDVEIQNHIFVKDMFRTFLLLQSSILTFDNSSLDENWNELIYIFTVGQYNLVSMALNTLGVQLEEGFEGFPK